MAAPIIFSRTATLAVAASTLTLSAIPQTARDLLISLRARYDTDTTTAQWLGLRLNGDSSLLYRANASGATTTTYSQNFGGDGFNVGQFSLGWLAEAQAGTAGMFSTWNLLLPRYSVAEVHAINGQGTTIWDTGANEGTYYRQTVGGYHNSAVAISSLELLNQNAADFAVDTEISVYGLETPGDVNITSRGTLAGAPTPTLDFDPAADAILDYAATNAAQTFSASNVTLGRELYVHITGGGGSTTIAFPAGTLVLENNYVAGADAVLIIKCINETGPVFIANLKDIV